MNERRPNCYSHATVISRARTAFMPSTLALILLSSCTTSNTFGTETRAVWCDALLETAATASVHDTPETQESVAANGETIDGLCG